MESDDIKPIDCSKSYGNPSGHANTVACFYTAWYLLTFFDKPLGQAFSSMSNSEVHPLNRSQSFNRGLAYLRKVLDHSLFKYAMLALLISVVFLVGFSRIVLGAHSIN